MRDRRRAFLLGRSAESRIIWWYRLRGYRIVGRNVRTGGGEIDIIVRRFRTIAFVEVKARARGALEHQAYAVDDEKRGRIIRAANHWRITHRAAVTRCTFRYDVACVTGEGLRATTEVWRGAFRDEVGVGALRPGTRAQ